MAVLRSLAVLLVVLLGVASPGRGEQALPSMAEIDAIRSHITKFWTLPAGARNAGHVVELAIEAAKDGAVQSVTVTSPPSPPEPEWTKVALSARRAVLLASPLPLPAGKQSHFKKFVLVFNTKT